ncbi:MAG TPA: DegV family protein [Chloroflexi bacterium]|nr:DegV family protein [Chloroflexota bacterium]
MSNKVAIVTDSAAYIPEEIRQGYPIHLIPMQLIWGDACFRDGIDIQPSEFYERLPNATVMPSTSQPSVGDFKALYTSLLDQDYQILSMHISGALSGTLDSARQAKDMLAGAPIEIVDTLSAGMGEGFQVLAAARAAADGASLSECTRIAESAMDKTGVLFIPMTLEFLRRGGRVSNISAFFGNLLDVKPILTLSDGKIVPCEKARTRAKALERLVDIFAAQVGDRRPVRIASLHANAPADAKALLEMAVSRFPSSAIADAFYADVSPVIGTHLGPGGLGIAYMAGM